MHNKKFEFDLSCGPPDNWSHSVGIAVLLFRDEESHNLENQKICVLFSTAKSSPLQFFGSRGTEARAAKSSVRVELGCYAQLNVV
jgi:hypothetical protein